MRKRIGKLRSIYQFGMHVRTRFTISRFGDVWQCWNRIIPNEVQRCLDCYGIDNGLFDVEFISHPIMLVNLCARYT